MFMAIRLFDLGRVVDVPVAYFFEEISGDMVKKSPSSLMGVKPVVEEVEAHPLAKRETLELVRTYYKIPSAAARRRLADLVKSIAKFSGVIE